MEKPFPDQASLPVLSSLELKDASELYTHATQLFNSGLYGAAARIYDLLVQSDRKRMEYWLALGLCHQRLEKYEEAAFCFEWAGQATLNDPRPAFFAGMSYRMLGKNHLASRAFDLTLRRCGEQSEYQGIRYSAAQLLAHCILENTGSGDRK